MSFVGASVEAGPYRQRYAQGEVGAKEAHDLNVGKVLVGILGRKLPTIPLCLTSVHDV